METFHKGSPWWSKHQTMPYGERVVWQTVHTRVRKSPWEITERITRKMPESSELGGMAQSVEHIVHIDGVVGSSPTVTTIDLAG